MMQVWLLRMTRWARNPPSLRRVVMVLGIVVVCLVLFGIERFWGWPEALTPDGGRRGRITAP